MTDLIVMRKDDALIEVHPSCVPDHQRNGWVIAPPGNDPAPAEPLPAEPPTKPKRKKSD